MTTEAAHTCELIERHTILLPTDYPDVAHVMAEDWAESQGMRLTNMMRVERLNERGVTFTVTVGKGDLAADSAATSWRWSARMLHWRKVLSNGDGREGRRIVAREEGRSVSPAWMRGPVPAAPLPEAADQRPPWQRRADGWDEDEVERVREAAPPRYPAKLAHDELADSGYYRDAQRRREQALLGTVQPDRDEVTERSYVGDDGAVHTARIGQVRCGNCYQLGGAHHPDCVKRDV